MELYIIHGNAAWEFSVKMPFRILKVENNIPAKTVIFSISCPNVKLFMAFL